MSVKQTLSPVVVRVNPSTVRVTYVGIQGVTGPQGIQGATGPGTIFPAVNMETFTISAGQPVAVHLSGFGVQLACAASPALECVGFAIADVPPATSGSFQCSGPLTVSSWTVAFGAANLPAQPRIYLSVTPGMVASVPAFGSRALIQILGRPFSGLSLAINLNVIGRRGA